MSAKQPSEVLDYDFDWTKRLTPSTDTIATATVVCEDVDLTILDTEVSDYIVKQWVSGGIHGETYKLTCRIVTTNADPMARELEAEMYIPVKEV
jgi:hypothetical protein